MLAASLTATQTTTAANTASIATPTANNRTNDNNNVKSKKIVLYNPTFDYSAPLQQQINPDIIGAHPYAQQYQQQCGLSSSSSSGSGGGGTVSTIHNTNQVRLPLQQIQQQTQQQSLLSAFTPVVATRLSLAGLAAAAATNAINPSSAASVSSPQQQQQILAALPLKLSEQCNLNNLHLNSFVSLEQQQSQHNNNNQVVGLLGRNVDAKGLLVNNNVGSSISNLIISNNLTTNAATTTADATETNKLNALWGQSQSTINSYGIAGATNTNANQIFSNPASDAISALWSCTSPLVSIGSSSTSGCSVGSGSQPSLSPTSSTSTRPDYRGNCKEPLWSSLQTSPPTSNSNNLRDTYYTTKSGVAINAANALVGGGVSAIRNGASNNATDNGGQQSNSPSASSTCSSSTSSCASSTCSSGLGSNAGIDVGVWPNCKLQSYFATTTANRGTIAGIENSQFAKISNIWDIANSTSSATTRTTDLFNDLWCSSNTATTSHSIELAEPIDFSDATNIWGTSAAINGTNVGTRAHIKPTASATIGANNNNNNKVMPTNLSLEGENGGISVGEADSGAACMQLFSEQFLNYMNIINYAD